jgi:hypothetical protein
VRGQPETGESTASINRRADDEAWPRVRDELASGATLLRVPRLRKAYPDKGHGPYGSGITDARLRKLERERVLRHVGVDRYELVS